VTANDQGVLAVSEPASVYFLAGPSPNPSLGPLALRFGLARAGETRLELFDVAGRRVRTLASGVLGAGIHAAEWDGRDEAGQPTHAGVYFLRLETGSRSFHTKLVRLE
jgi:hypothetical protein